MKHLDEFTVEFNGSISRQVVEGQAVVKYYRNNFTIEGKNFSVRSADDLSGLTGVVAFVAKGEPTPDGKVVANDAFTLRSVTSIAALQNKLTRRKLENEIKGLA